MGEKFVIYPKAESWWLSHRSVEIIGSWRFNVKKVLEEVTSSQLKSFEGMLLFQLAHI